MSTEEKAPNEGVHAAGAAALGFYYQAMFALVTLVTQVTDDAAVVVERLDDVEVQVDGNTLLYQLKHSMSANPPPVSLASRALWKTAKVWIDALPSLTLSETTLHLVTVGAIPVDSPLSALLVEGSARDELLIAMQNEAQRVVEDRNTARIAGEKLPHSERAAGCEAFLSVGATDQLNLLRRMRICDKSPSIDKIEARVAAHMLLIPEEYRASLAERLVAWWDRQVMYSLCGKRDRVLTRAELQHQIAALIGDIEDAKLLPELMNATPPGGYQPDGMLTRQIRLVDGRDSDVRAAIREEWRAREQRSRWLNDNPAMASTIGDYDLVLQEQWSDRHSRMSEECSSSDDVGKCSRGLDLLRWTHDDAPNSVPAFSEGWNGPYYVRGSYQVLAIDLEVGWHPEYRALLKEDK